MRLDHMNSPTTSPTTSLSQHTYDVIVIGGGINGTGVARDCALRGLKVALFEKHDLGFGASGNNSGMIHGGPRYLSAHPEVTRTSCIDSGYIQHIAPHLLFRIPFLVPVEGAGLIAKTKLAAYDAFFAFYDHYQPLKRGREHCMLNSNELTELEPGIRGTFAGAVTFDEWGVDGTRLCALNAVDARTHGAHIFVHHEVNKLLTSENPLTVKGVSARNTLSGAPMQATAKVVINASGAWCNRLLGETLTDSAKNARWVRPGKGIHVLFDRRLSNYGVVTNAIDGRQIFIMPWYNLSWIATTDDDVFSDLDTLRATEDEVAYLIDSVARVFPAVRTARVIGTTVAARPTIFEYGKNEDALSREHRIVDHGAVDNVDGLYSMIGGKLASYRIFAQEMSDIIARKLGNAQTCTTHSATLPGGDSAVDADALANAHGLSAYDARRLVARQGTRANTILSDQTIPPSPASMLCPCEGVTAAEVRFVCKNEFAQTLDDVSRRTRLGQGPCGAMHCAHRAAHVVANEHGYSAEQTYTMANNFIVDRYQRRAVAPRNIFLAQEELLGAALTYSGLAHSALRQSRDDR